MLVAAAGACLALALVIALALKRELRGDESAGHAAPVIALADEAGEAVAASELEPGSVESRSVGAVRVDPRPPQRAPRAKPQELVEAERAAAERAAAIAALPGKLRVRVVDEHGRVLEGLSGKILLARALEPGRARDDVPYARDAELPARGVLELDRLALGSWSIVVDVRDREAAASIELTPAVPEREVDVVLVPWRELRVRLCEPNGAPFADALEREFPGHAVMLQLELNDPSASTSAAVPERTSPIVRRLAGKRDELLAGENARTREEAERILRSDALQFRVLPAGSGDDAPWRTLSVSSFGALVIDVRFGDVVVAHGFVPAGVQDVTLTATLGSFRDVLRTLHVTIVDGATEQPLPGVSVRLRWNSVETTPPRFTDGNGAVAFDGQLPRKVAVDVVPADYDSLSAPFEIASDADSNVTVRVFRPGTKPVEASVDRTDGRASPRR